MDHGPNNYYSGICPDLGSSVDHFLCVARCSPVNLVS